MGKGRIPDAVKAKAERLYRSGMKTSEIAKRLGVSPSTIRSWKTDQHWEAKNIKKRIGPPLGNKNAVGNRGGPLKPGDKIAEKHGAYSKVYWDVLDDTEKDMICGIPKDAEMLLIEQIQLFTVRERRIMAAINKYREQQGQTALLTVTNSESRRVLNSDEEKAEYSRVISEKVKKGERLPGEAGSVVTTFENKDSAIARLEKELSTIQAKKTKAIEALAKIQQDKKKEEEEKRGGELVKAWADAVSKAREGEKKDG